MTEPAFLVVPISSLGQPAPDGSSTEQVDSKMQEHVAKRKLTREVTDIISKNADLTSHKHGLGKQTTDAGFREAERSKSTDQRANTVKNLISDPSILYSLINKVENPRLTLASFTITMSLVLAARYMPILQWALKTISLVLGVVSVTELSSRLVSKDSLLSRVRPKKYYRISDQTFDRVSSEGREAVKFIVLRCQSILYGENITNTILAFAVSIISFWLVKLVPLRWLILSGIPILYAIPLMFSSGFRDSVQETSSNAAGTIVNATKTATDATTKRLSDLANNTADVSGRAIDGSLEGMRAAASKTGDMSNTVARNVSDTVGKSATSDTAGYVPKAPENGTNKAFHHASEIASQSSSAKNGTRHKVAEDRDSVLRQPSYDPYSSAKQDRIGVDYASTRTNNMPVGTKTNLTSKPTVTSTGRDAY